MLGRGAPGIAVAALDAAVALGALLRVRRLLCVAERIREPFVRPLSEHECFDGLAGALAAYPALLRARFALARVWGRRRSPRPPRRLPAAHFLVEAILSRGRVGPGRGLLLAVNLVLGLLTLRAGAVRLSTWRLSASAHRAVTGGYAG